MKTKLNKTYHHLNLFNIKRLSTSFLFACKRLHYFVLVIIFVLLPFLTIQADQYKHVFLKPQYGSNSGNNSSRFYTSASWGSLSKKDYTSVHRYTDKCIKSFSRRAQQQQQGLFGFPEKNKAFSYWALNDVATCLFIKGKALVFENKTKEAKKIFEEIIQDYFYAQCWDTRGYFWKVAEAAQDQILSMEKGIDFGDYSSDTLTTRAWIMLQQDNLENARIYAEKCIDLFTKEAFEQQQILKDKPAPKDSDIFKFWALNDVSTCWFIKAKSFYNQGQADTARKIFSTITTDFPSAQCWDPRGWFWNVAEASRDQLLMIDLGIDFGDYASQTLTTKAWLAYEYGDFDAALIFVNKCIKLYEENAIEQQTSLSDFASNGTAFNFWALNDVATCWYIRGLVHSQRNELREALTDYKKVTEQYSYAQCWDPRGFFWKISLGASMEIDRILSILVRRSKIEIEYTKISYLTVTKSSEHITSRE